MVTQRSLDRIESPEFLDTFHAVLADSDRRSVLRSLTTKREPTTVGQLASELAATEHSVPVADVTSAQRDERALVLHHAHLPLLDDVGAVSYSRESQRVELTPLWEAISSTIPTLNSALDPSPISRQEV